MGLSRGKAIQNFIKDQILLFNKNHISNFDQIINKFNYFDYSIKENPLNNTVAFFFKDGQCSHGARFLKNMNGGTLEKWTSKLGSQILISHEIQDLTGIDSIYGAKLLYAGIIENSTNIIEEL